MDQRDLLLVPFPFSDLSRRKVRPVIVISNNKFNNFSEDRIVVGITSNVSKNKYTINLDNNQLEEGKLLTKCCVKVENILKVEKRLIIKKIGKVKLEILEDIISKLDDMIKPLLP